MIRWTKLSVNKLVKKALHQVLDTSAALEAVTFVTPQHREAARAFVEKRKPNSPHQRRNPTTALK